MLSFLAAISTDLKVFAHDTYPNLGFHIHLLALRLRLDNSLLLRNARLLGHGLLGLAISITVSVGVIALLAVPLGLRRRRLALGTGGSSGATSNSCTSRVLVDGRTPDWANELLCRLLRVASLLGDNGEVDL